MFPSYISVNHVFVLLMSVVPLFSVSCSQLFFWAGVLVIVGFFSSSFLLVACPSNDSVI